MKSTSLVFGRILAGLLFACAGLSAGSGQEESSASTVQPRAPAGTYAHFGPPAMVSPFQTATNRTPLFTLRLETNGTYLAKYTEERVPTQDGDLVRLLPRTNTAQGTWRWDAQKREFQLEPGTFIFYIKRLPVDEADPNRLVWGSGFLERLETK